MICHVYDLVMCLYEGVIASMLMSIGCMCMHAISDDGDLNSE